MRERPVTTPGTLLNLGWPFISQSGLNSETTSRALAWHISRHIHDMVDSIGVQGTTGC
jgi:dihydrodipicolinate synthase/N-acetylneuraminate lyase